jgi:acyl-CoA thioester hydrolase
MIEPFKVQVRFADLDVLGHVNNSVYLTYFEAARVYYFKHLLQTDWDWQTDSVVLVKNEVEYVRPIFLHDVPEIELSTAHVGTKSFTFRYEIRVNGELCSQGSSTLVAYDVKSGSTVEIKPEMRRVLEQLKREQ